MKILIFSILIILFTTGCQESSSKKNNISLMDGYRDGVNPNSVAYKNADKQKDRQNKVDIAKIDSDAKIEIAKIQSQNQVLIAKVNADAKKEVAQTESTTKVKTSEIDAITKKDDIQTNLYITIAIIIAVLIAMLLLYLNNKRSSALKEKLHNDKLKHEQLLKEREFEEQRLHKMLDLVKEGKLPSNMQEEIILSLTKSKTNLIESK
nr:hypothetical protein [uncultured Sulfurimonas sp.]